MTALETVRAFRLTVASSLLLTAGSAASAQLLANRPFIPATDFAPSASFVGPHCGAEVSFVFGGKDRATFNKDGVATRLMSNVVQTIRRSCPRVTLVAAKGVVGQDIVYNAVAEADSNWLLLELGSSRDSSLFSGGAAGSSADRANFAKRRDFSGVTAIFAATRTKPFLCSNLAGVSCTSASEFRNPSDDGASVVARSLLDGSGTEAVLSYSAANRNGFLCSNPQQAKIDVVGGSASAAARTRMATDLRERLKPYGDQVCSGYAMRGDQIISANFSASGARIGSDILLSALTAQPKLRQEK